MNKIKLLVLIIISSAGNISAQSKAFTPIDVYITSQMQLRMHENSPANFYVPANSKQETIEVSGALQIDVQTNRDWILQVKNLNVANVSDTETMSSESLRIRADGKSFVSLDEKGINIRQGSKGSYQSAGNSFSIDYELTFKNNRKPKDYRINLLYTLVAI